MSHIDGIEHLVHSQTGVRVRHRLKFPSQGVLFEGNSVHQLLGRRGKSAEQQLLRLHNVSCSGQSSWVYDFGAYGFDPTTSTNQTECDYFIFRSVVLCWPYAIGEGEHAVCVAVLMSVSSLALRRGCKHGLHDHSKISTEDIVECSIKTWARCISKSFAILSLPDGQPGHGASLYGVPCLLSLTR